MPPLRPLPQPPLLELRHPVVLMHGFGSLAALSRPGQLHGAALALRAHGVRAFAPNVAPYLPIAERAKQWRDRLERVLDETKADRVYLVAHSMGGLDARYLVSVLGMHDVVDTLVTVSTPHRGTPLCDFLLDGPASLRSTVVRVLTRVGERMMPDERSDVMQAVREMTSAHVCSSFNTRVADHPSVRYWSYAGRAGVGTPNRINPALALQNRIVSRRAGVNDGYVPVESARWGAFQGYAEADHLQLIGINGPFGPRFDADSFYVGIARRLARSAD